MLVEFTVENYRSFRNPVTLSMIASADDSLPENVIRNAQGSGYDLLRAVGVFGANASGKSNLFWAMRVVRNLVQDSARQMQAGDPIPVQPFRFDPELSGAPSRFKVVFLVEGATFEYSFAATPNEVVEESIFDISRRRVKLMQRKGKSITLGASLDGKSGAREYTIRPNALWLSEAMQRGHKLATLLGTTLFMHHGELRSDWLNESITLKLLGENSVQRDELLALLRRADINIEAIDVLSVAAANSRQFRRLPQHMRQELAPALIHEAPRDEVRFTHSAVLEAGFSHAAFEIEEESEGTQKLFAVGGPLAYAWRTGMTVYADEFDLRFHPLITEMLIRQFLTPGKDTGAQLIFSSHSPLPMGGTLLGGDLVERGHDYLRRDQIVFVDKGPDAASELYSLWDYKDVRKGEDRVSRYLKGRYRAVPQVRLTSGNGGKP